MRFRRKTRGWGWGALLAAILAPSVAQAQLFPNLPTQKRVRPDCAEELPVYGMYRHKYYGYYPTCWRQFPPGWGCPSTESPDWQAELARQPLDIPEDDFPGLDGLGSDPFETPGTDDLLPDLPRQRSPFELDQPGQGDSPFDAPRRSPSPFEADPFETPNGGQANPTSSPPSVFDLPGSSSIRSDEVPQGTAARSSVSDPIALLPQLPSVPELAVLPDSRPRPIRLPTESDATSRVNVLNVSRVDGEIIGSRDLPATSLNSRPVGLSPTTPFNSPAGIPAGLIDDSHSIPFSQSIGSPTVPGEIEYAEPRPRRGLFSGIFGRRR